uniref:Uncharacterized protein n=1 Tax=Anguilla anguilla TaxID=7936 RepID=A0A0E9TAA4_ANGAN
MALKVHHACLKQSLHIQEDLWPARGSLRH